MDKTKLWAFLGACGCFIPIAIGGSLLDSGELHSFWGKLLFFFVLVESTIIGLFLGAIVDDDY